ncbi:hypothetical protein V1517DRAFT_338150 [Lipomyces orientalis]|uniref:Uncharacterized protein n=1 Tax=Lipomyces orientalis TaxID=1233043 RepID=A0ACC3TQJ4_9ASCO
MSSHEIAAAETAALPSQRRLRHQRVSFLPAAQEDEKVVSAVSKQEKGKTISSYYSSLVGLSTTTNVAAEGTDASLRESGEGSPPVTSIPGQLSLPHLEPPVTHLPVDENNTGRRYLVRYGWQPLQREGLGQKGREGRRLPLKAEPRPHNVGVGAKVVKNKTAQEGNNKPKKITKGKRKAQEKEARQRDRAETQRLYNEIMK